MKKIFKIIAIAVIILILGILTLFYSRINKISLIENIRQKIAKTEEIKNASEVTIIDITDLEDGGNLEHEHIIKTMYDENKHWEECTVCNKKENETIHNYTNSWTLGTANDCRNNNVNKFVCSCGYSYESIEERKVHTWQYTNSLGSFSGYNICEVCRDVTNSHQCCKSDGTRINCLNLGICDTCKYNYANKAGIHHYCFQQGINEDIHCQQCNTYIGKVTRCDLVRESFNIYKLYTTMVVPTNAIFNATTYTQTFGDNVTIQNNISRSGTTYNNVLTLTFNGHNESTSYAQLANGYSVNGRLCMIYISSDNFRLDNEEPEVTNITMNNNEELIKWSKSKPITITGTENYCNTVKVKITDKEENTIFEGNGNVTNQNYQIRCIPEIECDTNGKTFILTVADNCGNSTIKEFTIAKVDNIPPTPTSESEILGDWANSKDFTFTATDYGIGQVSIAFNDIEDLQLAKLNENTYSRDYKFTGDVYQPKQLSVMYKDGLGNTQVQKITIDKIDNTAPTITNAELHNNIITITSHDEHETLGEGSGVVKYRYLASEEKIENPELKKENSTEVNKTEEIKIKDIYKMKYIYVVAEDYVGNTSEVYEFKIPELKLTATANPNTANGKGEIILDWSSYDVTDKYFMIYRKKENQENWETIVSLEQKLIGSTYIDTLANDEAKPNIQSITITGDTKNNNINVTANSNDNGTQYNYYIEAYDSTGELLSKSNNSILIKET